MSATVTRRSLTLLAALLAASLSTACKEGACERSFAAIGAESKFYCEDGYKNGECGGVCGAGACLSGVFHKEKSCEDIGYPHECSDGEWAVDPGCERNVPPGGGGGGGGAGGAGGGGGAGGPCDNLAGTCASDEVCVTYEEVGLLPTFYMDDCAQLCSEDGDCANGCHCNELSDGRTACVDTCLYHFECMRLCGDLFIGYGCVPSIPGNCDALEDRNACEQQCNERYWCPHCDLTPSETCGPDDIMCACPEVHGVTCHESGELGSCG